jgi:hypothetical protein
LTLIRRDELEQAPAAEEAELELVGSRALKLSPES